MKFPIILPSGLVLLAFLHCSAQNPPVPTLTNAPAAPPQRGFGQFQRPPPDQPAPRTDANSKLAHAQ